jgi:dolichol-phosphate mannosyltransferase
MTLISVVIPLMNEERLIFELVERVSANVMQISEKYELILVDDGSTDNTWCKIEEIAKKDKSVKGLKLSRNFGHHYAITAGLEKSLGEWVIVMDGDLQDRPEVIPALYKKCKEGFDVVFVSRKNRGENLVYKLAQKLFYICLRILSGINFDSTQANFSIINRKVVEAFNKFPENARFYGSTILWLGFNRTKISADHGVRSSGTTSYSLRKRIKLASDIILSFSDRPLKISVFIGIFISTCSGLSALWVLIKVFISGYSVSGWASLIFSIFFFNGILLVILGILGIYIGKIFQEVKKRPLFIISEQVNFN